MAAPHRPVIHIPITSPRVYTFGTTDEEIPGATPKATSTPSSSSTSDFSFINAKLGPVPKPTGEVGETYDENDKFGTAWWRDIYERVIKVHTEPLFGLLKIIASTAGIRMSNLMSDGEGDMLLENIFKFTEVAQEARIQTPSSSTFMKPISRAPAYRPLSIREEKDESEESDEDGSTSQSSTSSQSTPFVQAASSNPASTPATETAGPYKGSGKKKKEERGNTKEGTKTKAEAPPPPPMPRGSKDEALVWLLSNFQSLNASHLAAINEMFPEGEKVTSLKWMTHPFMSGWIPVDSAVTGAIQVVKHEIERDLGQEVTEEELILREGGNMVTFGRLVGHHLRLIRPSRLTSAEEIASIKFERARTKDELLENLRQSRGYPSKRRKFTSSSGFPGSAMAFLLS